MKETKMIFHRLLALTLAAGLCLSASGCGKKEAEEDGVYTAGEYTASAQGMGGQVPVTVTFSANEITKVEIGEHNETPGISDPAIEQLPDAIMKAQSADVDVVSGATVTSTAIIEAVKSCIAQAKGESQSGGSGYTPGTYTATTYGMGGEYHVIATFSEKEILSIDTSDNSETLMLGTEALRILTERVLENQSLDLDAVSCATVSSNSFIRGIEDCVKQAGGDVDALKAVKITIDTYEDRTHEADVLVIGGGLAGISSAASAVENGASVILLEQRSFMGGHSVLPSGMLLLGDTELQETTGVKDSVEEFDAWMQEFGQYKKDPTQTRLLAERSQDIYDFAVSMGGEFDTSAVYATDDSPVNRSHMVSPNIGVFVSSMANTMMEMGVDVRYNTRAEGFILNEDGEIIGVKCTDYYGNATEYYADNIVLATGGYGGNKEMLLEYWGDAYKNLVYGGLEGTDGTMLLAAMEIGADAVDLDNPHLDACADLNTGITITGSLSTKGGAITVRQSTSQRIANESTSHAETLAAEMLRIGDPYYIIIYDDTAFEVTSSLTYKIEFYNNAGLVQKYDSLEALAEAFDLDAVTLQETIDNYNAAVRGDIEDDFGRTQFNQEISAPFYATKVNNGVTTTTGGLKIDEHMQVLDTDGNAIPHLYAAGEITGGIRINYIGGTSLSHAIMGGIVIGEWIAETSK